jgi:uncharacterized protein (TIGR04141 family)
MARTETISIYLLKDTVSSAAAALKSDVEGIREHRVDAGETQGTVFVADTDEHEPDWVRLLKPVTQPPVSDSTQSTSAVMMVQAADRWFAMTFGQGRHLLDRAIYERRFGLKVALNAVDPERLRGAQARTFNDHALHTQRQLSRLSRVEALELDAQRDLVTALGGDILDSGLGKRIDGRDAVRLTAELEPHEISAKCAELLAESRQTRYRKEFPWIDTIEEITDPDEIERLEGQAAGALGRREFSAFDLFPPELVSEEIVEYRLSPAQGGLVVIEPDESLLRFPLHAPMSAGDAERAARRYKLIGLDANGQEVERWSFWECLHYEHRQGGSMLVLDGGSWYRVEQAFSTDVEQFVQALGSSGLQLPDAERGESEGAYNARAARKNGLALLDKKNIRLPGQTAIEPCDLFTSDRQFVHVKHRKGGSAPLSHLFGQASVSSECLVTERAFREELRSKLKAEKPGWESLIDEPVDARNFQVVLALITKPGTTGPAATALPFFSKVFLRQTVRRLRAMGYAVYVDEIPTEAPRVRRRRPARAPAPKAVPPARRGSSKQRRG